MNNKTAQMAEDYVNGEHALRHKYMDEWINIFTDFGFTLVRKGTWGFTMKNSSVEFYASCCPSRVMGIKIEMVNDKYISAKLIKSISGVKKWVASMKE